MRYLLRRLWGFFRKCDHCLCKEIQGRCCYCERDGNRCLGLV